MNGSAAEIAAAVRSRQRSALEITREYLTKAESAQDDLNAFTKIDRDGAERRAAAVDRTVAAGTDPGPLAGVPIAIKDLIDQAGQVTTAGSSFLHEEATASAPVVAGIEKAGAVIVGRTGLHEFAFGFSSENHWWGPVRNPWDPSTSPGGSSGGSAAAVAAGLATAALGTDTGGSVRVPAALCGIVGLKVTHGRVSTRGVFPLAGSLDTVGPMAATAADAALLYDAICGDDPADPWSRPHRDGDEVDGRLAGLRVGVPVPWTETPVEPQIRESYRRALDDMANAGASVSEITIPELDTGFPLADVFSPEVAVVHRQWFESKPEAYGPDVARRVAAALAVTLDANVAARRRQAALRSAVSRAFATCDILATPATAGRRKVIGVDMMDLGTGPPVPYRAVLSAFSALVNQLGAPAIAFPLKPLDPEERVAPVSIQLVGKPWSERLLLSIVSSLEAAEIAGASAPPRR